MFSENTQNTFAKGVININALKSFMWVFTNIRCILRENKICKSKYLWGKWIPIQNKNRVGSIFYFHFTFHTKDLTSNWLWGMTFSSFSFLQHQDLNFFKFQLDWKSFSKPFNFFCNDPPNMYITRIAIVSFFW